MRAVVNAEEKAYFFFCSNGYEMRCIEFYSQIVYKILSVVAIFMFSIQNITLIYAIRN